MIRIVNFRGYSHNTILMAMVSTMRLLLLLLLNPKHCLAFTFGASQITIRQSIRTPLFAAINGNSDNDTQKQPNSSSPQNFLPRRPHRRLDKSSVFAVDNVSNKTSSLPQKSSLIDSELCYVDDLPGSDVGETCFVSNPSTSSSSPILPFEVNIPTPAIDLTLRFIPVVMPILAYSTYEQTARLFDETVVFISNNNWVAVDGGQYQSSIITPAINGLVVPSMALLFATLVSNTINTLRNRQLLIRTSLNTEANDLRMLSTMVDSLPSELRETKNHLREYLIQYASRVIAESQPGLSVDNQVFIGSMDSEINGFLSVWNRLSMAQYSTMYVDTFLPASNYTIDQSAFGTLEQMLNLPSEQRKRVAPFIPPYFFTEAYDALTRLRHERSIRLSALQSTYPTLHYVILGLLAGSICTVFLMETNQELLIFLSAIQLRILWSMLIGTFSALAVVNYDLIDPFRGSCECSCFLIVAFISYCLC